jgi:hypothetical protein
MKKLSILLSGVVSLTTSVLLIACGNQKQSEPAQYAATPTSVACLYGATTCDSSQYALYYGFQAYPGFQTIYVNPNSTNRYTINNTTYFESENMTTFCNCPLGTRPVYNGLIGMGCVNSQMVGGQFGQPYLWGQTNNQNSGAGAYNYVNWNQVSNMNYGDLPNGCYTDMAWSCFIDVPNGCFQGYTCKATLTNSRLGICSK